MHVYSPYLVGWLRNFTLNMGTVARGGADWRAENGWAFMFTAQPLEERGFSNLGNMFLNSLTTYNFNKKIKSHLQSRLTPACIPWKGWRVFSDVTRCLDVVKESKRKTVCLDGMKESKRKTVWKRRCAWTVWKSPRERRCAWTVWKRKSTGVKECTSFDLLTGLDNLNRRVSAYYLG